jgi:hypothetical protein
MLCTATLLARQHQSVCVCLAVASAERLLVRHRGQLIEMQGRVNRGWT